MLAHQQAADDFHRGGDTEHLGILDGGLAFFVKSFCLFLAVSQLRANPVRRRGGRVEILINLLFLRSELGGLRGIGSQQFIMFTIGFFALGGGAVVKFRAQRVSIIFHLGDPAAALGIDSQQLGFLVLDLIFNDRYRGWLENRVLFAHGRNSGINGFAHQRARDEVGVVVCGLGGFVSVLFIRVIGHLRLVGVVNPGLFGIPCGGTTQLDFAAGVQVGDSLGQFSPRPHQTA